MFQTIIGTISSFMYSKLLVILLIGAGVYFTVRTRFPQVRLFKNACGSVMEKPEDKGAISSFQALMVSTASRVGTGNIVGVIRKKEKTEAVMEDRLTILKRHFIVARWQLFSALQ